MEEKEAIHFAGGFAIAVLFDYLDWRGDLSFQADPPNEADVCLISKIGCPNLSGMVPSDARDDG